MNSILTFIIVIFKQGKIRLSDIWNDLKKYWDEIHPEFNFYTEKQLRQHSTFVEKKKLVLRSNQDSIYSEQIKSHDGSNLINIIDEDNHLALVSETSNVNGNPPPLNSLRTNNGVNSELKETLKANFLKNIERFQTILLKERPRYTKITRKPSENEIRIIDNIDNEYATNLKSDKAMLDYWSINVIIYMTAITLKNYLGDLKETKQEKITATKPGWIRNLEQRTVSLRRKILHTELIIKCEQLNTFTFPST